MSSAAAAYDPEWNPPSLVSRRLRSAGGPDHASALARRTTVEASLRAGPGDDDGGLNGNGGEGKDGRGSAREAGEAEEASSRDAARRAADARSSCPQPPLDDAITGGGSSAPPAVHRSGMDVRLDPLERCAPHRIVVPQGEGGGGGAVGGGGYGYAGGFGGRRGELDGASDPRLSERRSATWNAITALATLCEEVEELDVTFRDEILPSIVLFSGDDDDELSGGARRDPSKKDAVLDESARERRESQLLGRMGRFLPALQRASNGAARVRRLVRNMVVQLGGVQTPAAVPFYYDEARGKRGEGGGGGEAGGRESSESDVSSGDGRGNGAAEATTEEATQPPVLGPGVPMFRLGGRIADALRILVTVDAAIASNSDLLEAWAMYKDVVVEWSEQRREDNTLDPDFESFERMMVQLDLGLLSSRSFISAVEQNFDPRGRFRAARFPLHEEVKSVLVALYGTHCEQINTERETTERADTAGIYAMYVLYRHLLPPNVVPDAKLHKSLWSVFPAMCPVMELYGPLHFVPREFMMTYAPYKAVRGCYADVPEIRSASATMVLKWNASFAARVAKIRLEALGWLAAADSELSPTVPEPRRRTGNQIEEEEDEDGDGDGDGEDAALASSVARIGAATTCIFRGARIARAASILLRSQLATHRALGLKVDSDHLPSLMSLMEVLKSIEKMLRVRRRSAVLSFQRSTLKMIASNILKKFDLVRSFVDQCSSSMDFSRNSERARSITRVGACLTALEGVLKGSSSFSPIRRHSVAFAIAACMDTMILEVFSTDDLLLVEGHLKDLGQVASIEETLDQICDCSFLYFYRDLFPGLIGGLYRANATLAAGRAQLILSALSDPERTLAQVRHLERDPQTGMNPCSAGYRKYVISVVNDEYVKPACETIETEIRLAASGSKGFDYRLRKLMASPPLYVCHTKLDVKAEVEKYLEKTYYDLCTLNLNDCNVYTHMTSIATERYGLHLTDPFLPDGSLDQGVDFMEILRDLDSFISKYNFNLIEQSFVERRPERGAKHLCTLDIKCVAASLKQHGVGVVSSAVNVCYKLLAKTFQSFTRLFANDKLKSLLSRELRWFNNEKGEGNSIYSFVRASDFAQEVKKLDASSGNNGLDECRIIITEMGNCISLVRVIRAAKRRVLSDEMPFLPSYDSPGSAGGDETKPNAKSGVDGAISAILSKQDPDFVRAFVNVFAGVTSQSDDSFMESFFCIVPALCLCWMESSIQGKETMHKKNLTRDGYYTDDGFAVGLAFILSVLGQIKSYESLNWFKSIQSKYAAEEEDWMEKKNAYEVKRNAKMAASKQSLWFSSGTEEPNQEEDDEMTILTLMGKRLEGNRREMAMLFFSMHGAFSFFKEIRT